MVTCDTNFPEQTISNESLILLNQEFKREKTNLSKLIHKSGQALQVLASGGTGLVAIGWLKRSFYMLSSSTSALLDYYTNGISGFSPISPNMYWYYCAESCMYLTGSIVILGGASYLIIKSFSKEI